MSETRKIGRALISLSDKTGAVEFAQELVKIGAEIISTGGTAAAFRNAGIEVTEVSDITDFPEMMDGRVKTLHPKIHGALLALRDNDEHIAAMKTHGITPIDMVVINLYPFEATIKKEGISLTEAVENIDIGGPAMIRSASKNWRDVAVVTDPKLYPEIVEELNNSGGSLSLETRQRLATIAFTRTAAYDTAISNYLSKQVADDVQAMNNGVEANGGVAADESKLIAISRPANNFIEPRTSSAAAAAATATADELLPATVNITLSKTADLRYGENPHQSAALYRTSDDGGIAGAEQLHGKEMSFNNYVDAEAAWNLVNDFDELAVAIIKHTNPSGVGTGMTPMEAYKRALSTDPVSAFGGIVAFNQRLDQGVARLVTEVFSEVIVAPDYDDAALEILKTKKNLRVLRVRSPHAGNTSSPTEYKQISGGFLVQDADTHRLSLSDLNIVTLREPDEIELNAMLFAWTVCKHVKSNAIVLANAHQTLGVGSGQMNRVDSVRIAAMRAERFSLPIKGAALASDAFFPFRDNVDEAAALGVSAIIQPGGSIKDEESIAAANDHNIAMAFTGIRHFKH